MTRERAEAMMKAMGWRQIPVPNAGGDYIDGCKSYALFWNENEERMYLHNLEKNTWWATDRIEIFIDMFE